jgi:hypothetical protein
MAEPNHPENKLTSFIGLNPLGKLERIKLHVHLGRAGSYGSSTVAGIFRVDKVSALGSDDLALALDTRQEMGGVWVTETGTHIGIVGNRYDLIVSFSLR